MRIQFDDYKRFPHNMSEKDVMRQVDSSLQELEDKIRRGILDSGGTPIPDSVVRVYTAARDTSPFDHCATVAVKMYGEFPG